MLVAHFDVAGVVLLLVVDVAESKDDVGQITLAAVGLIQGGLQLVAAAVIQGRALRQKGLILTSGE